MDVDCLIALFGDVACDLQLNLNFYFFFRNDFLSAAVVMVMMVVLADNKLARMAARPSLGSHKSVMVLKLRARAFANVRCLGVLLVLIRDFFVDASVCSLFPEDFRLLIELPDGQDCFSLDEESAVLVEEPPEIFLNVADGVNDDHNCVP